MNNDVISGVQSQSLRKIPPSRQVLLWGTRAGSYKDTLLGPN